MHDSEKCQRTRNTTPEYCKESTFAIYIGRLIGIAEREAARTSNKC